MTDSSGTNNEIEALQRRIEAQERLIESLKAEADEAMRLRQEVRARDLDLERQVAELENKGDLIRALRADAAEARRLKGDGRAKDHEISRLKAQKDHAERRAAEVAEEFKILSAETLTGLDVAAEINAVRAELDARKTLIASLRRDASRAESLEAQLNDKRVVVARLETAIDRYVSTIDELRETAAAWKAKYLERTSRVAADDPAQETSQSGAVEVEQRAPPLKADLAREDADDTIASEFEEIFAEANRPTGSKIETNR